MFNLTFIIGFVMCFHIVVTQEHNDNFVWHFRCESDQCVKYPIQPDTIDPMGLVRCRHTCGVGHRGLGVDIWPQLTGHISIRDHDDVINFQPIALENLNFRHQNARSDGEFWTINSARFMSQCNAKRASYSQKFNHQKNNVNLASVVINTIVESNDTRLRIGVDETYRINVSSPNNNNTITITIDATTIFGARHAMETLTQLIIYDDIRDVFLMRYNVQLEDGPTYSHRGISLDTSRNFYPLIAIQRTIDAMAMVKLNVFHWHITDSHSFPVVIQSHPYLHRYGAFAPDKVYTAEDIRSIVQYAYYRGVHVIPEFDAPAHVGEGWQFTNLTTCFNMQAWSQFCYEAPCGQLDPTQDRLYDVLQDVYGELFEMFGRPQWFHMGGDEVKFECWQTSRALVDWMVARNWTRDQDGFMKLWNYFQTNALERLDRTGEARPEKIVLWTSSLTESPFLEKYLNPERYVIQVWTRGNDANIKHLLSKGYNLIMSNYDVLYLDCGYESWIGLGNNWCSPYSGWHNIYNQDLKIIGGERHRQILGSEVALWSEQADDQSLDGRLWPRAMALAERLWSDPSTSFRVAEPRILLQRQRFVENGIRAEQLQPEWCMQNEGKCPFQ